MSSFVHVVRTTFVAGASAWVGGWLLGACFPSLAGVKSASWVVSAAARFGVLETFWVFLLALPPLVFAWLWLLLRTLLGEMGFGNLQFGVSRRVWPNVVEVGSGFILWALGYGWVGWFLALLHSSLQRVLFFLFASAAGPLLGWGWLVLLVLCCSLVFLCFVCLVGFWLLAPRVKAAVLSLYYRVGVLCRLLQSLWILCFGWSPEELFTSWQKWMDTEVGSWSHLFSQAHALDVEARAATQGVASVDVTSFLPSQQRLRRRARWVRAAEAVLGGGGGRVGRFLRGRWTPDLPTADQPSVQRYLIDCVQDGARILGGGSTKSTDGEKQEVFFLVETKRGLYPVYPELLGRLRNYSLFRDRDAALLGGLRTRAVEWCRARQLPGWAADCAVAGTVPLAFEYGPAEISARNSVAAVAPLPTLFPPAA